MNINQEILDNLQPLVEQYGATNIEHLLKCMIAALGSAQDNMIYVVKREGEPPTPVNEFLRLSNNK